jgi:hypothetical protein
MIRIDELWLQHNYMARLAHRHAQEHPVMPEHAFAAARMNEQTAAPERVYSETRAHGRAATRGAV